MKKPGSMIHITPSIAIDEKEITEVFVRSAGPGGQHVNKVSTAVQLRFDVAGSPSLSADTKKRLLQMAGSRLTESGLLIIHAQRFRSREQNRKDAQERLRFLIRKAAEVPKHRIPTRPSRASRQRRMADKRHRAAIKRCRRPPGSESKT